MTIQLLIPVKVGPETPERVVNLKNCLLSMADIKDVVVNVIDVHSDVDMQALVPVGSLCPIKIIETPFTKFNKSAALNYGLGTISDTDIVAVVDADHLNPPDLAETIHSYCRPGKIVFPVPYSLHRGCSAELCGDDADPTSDANGWWRVTSTGPAWGYAEDFRAAGGYPHELGKCWGAEDGVFFARAHEIHATSRPRIPGIYHQWHPSAHDDWAYTTVYAEEQPEPVAGQEMPCYGWQDLSEQAKEDLTGVAPNAIAELLNSHTAHRWSWSVGITTANRQESLLADTVRSLGAAGWDKGVVFSEPDLVGWDRDRRVDGGMELRLNTEKLGAWRNWRSALRTLWQENPHADFYALFQDDIVLWNGCREYFEKQFSPETRSVFSFYTCGGYITMTTHVLGDKAGQPRAAPPRGWSPDSSPYPGHMGAYVRIIPQCLIQTVCENLPENVPDNKHIDTRFGELLNTLGIELLRHNPSLMDHSGAAVSTLGYDTGGDNRVAANFVGETSPGWE